MRNVLMLTISLFGACATVQTPLNPTPTTPTVQTKQEEPKRETLTEAVERKAKQALVDRALVPIYAASVAALQDGRTLPAMPEDCLETARRLQTGWSSNCTAGKSEVTVKHVGDFVTFEIRPSAMSEIDKEGRSYHQWQPDPISDLLQWTHQVQSKGLVFAKSGETIASVIPDSMGCMGMTRESNMHEGINQTCDRFGLGRNDNDFSFTASPEEKQRERQFLAEFMSVHGTNGVLTREAAQNALTLTRNQIFDLTGKTEETNGYVRYRQEAQIYELVPGPLVKAELYKRDSRVISNGEVSIELKVFSERVHAVRLALRRAADRVLLTDPQDTLRQNWMEPNWISRLEEETGKKIAEAGLGTGGIASFTFLKMHLPADLQPGTIEVVATAMDAQGNTLVADESVGSFDY